MGNQFSLPWDVDVVKGKYVSFLPENLRFQLNPYLSICVKRVDNPALATATASATTGLSINHRVNGHHIANNDDNNNDDDTINALALKVNIAVFDAIIRAFISLCAEYCRALQRKHWDRSDEVVVMRNGMTEMMSSIEFLCAVANDCHRVIDVHFQELLGCIDVTKV